MLRNILVIYFIFMVLGCKSKSQDLDQLSLKQREAQNLAASLQAREISTAAKTVNATSLIPDGNDWKYRFQAQDYFASLQGKNVLVEIEVSDVVRQADGLIISGEPPGFNYPLLFWLRLHGISEQAANKINSQDRIVCIGTPTTTVPAGPYFEMQSVTENEVEIKTSAIPLILDVSCTQSWHKLSQPFDLIKLESL